jgi:uncharacterized membrane-anchored protein
MNLSNSSGLADVVAWVIGIINTIIPVLMVLALVFFLYSALQYVLKAQESKGNSQREALLWGLVALFVLVSVWGLVRIMCSTLFGSASCNAPKGDVESLKKSEAVLIRN